MIKSRWGNKISNKIRLVKLGRKTHDIIFHLLYYRRLNRRYTIVVVLLRVCSSICVRGETLYTYLSRRSSHNFYIKMALFWDSQPGYDFRTGNVLNRFVNGRVRFVFELRHLGFMGVECVYIYSDCFQR